MRRPHVLAGQRLPNVLRGVLELQRVRVWPVTVNGVLKDTCARLCPYHADVIAQRRKVSRKGRKCVVLLFAGELGTRACPVTDLVVCGVFADACVHAHHDVVSASQS